MGVVVKEVRCLSADSGNEQFYAKKAIIGDIVTVFTRDGKNYQGKIKSITDNYLTLGLDTITRRWSLDKKFKMSDIGSFNVDFHGETNKRYFS